MNPVWLVAHREISTRLRSKAFRIATLVLMLILIGLAVGVKLINAHSSQYTVGVTNATSPLAGPLRATATAVGEKVSTPSVPDDATGQADIASGKLDALLVGDGSSVQVVVKENVPNALENLLHVLAGQIVLSQQITSLGGNPALVTTAVAHAPVTVTSLHPPHTYDGQRLTLGIIAGILIYLSLMLNGQAVAQGVVEEKSSRVVELLLATLRPWQLMTGKVLGIGIVGLIQMVIIGTVGVVAGVATGALTLSVSAAAGTVVWLVVWFLLGFVAYALTFAALAALVSRQEDVTAVVTPVLILVVIGYVLGISILPSNPGSGLIEVLSLIPAFAPTLMPMRLAMGGVPVWEAALPVAGMFVVIPALIWISGRIYRNAVMRTGARVKLSEAWRGSGSTRGSR
jgi:ABC-2 type transport system permease protein